MKVDTKAFGVIEVDEKDKIIFPRGLFGFEDYKDYIMFNAEHEPFVWLQSTEEMEIAFILIDPFLFRKDYEANINDEELADIGIKPGDKAVIYVIVTIPQDGGAMTANLQGPVIINKDDRKGMQAILSDVKWKTKHDIIAELNGTDK
ncbi:MAG: flagellar assembly protein FliW [Treponema sp.]|nr:flagellar assembly protein FliW [Treponema sp.]